MADPRYGLQYEDELDEEARWRAEQQAEYDEQWPQLPDLPLP